MKMNPLGRTGIEVSEICLGSMTWGSQNSEAEGHEQIDFAIGQGVNFIDTAEMYPTTPFKPETIGRTEEIIGTWLAARKTRDDVVVATKVSGQGRVGGPINRQKVIECCEGSLKRLQTDHIDLYQLHWPNRGSYHFRQTWTYSPESQDTAKALDEFESTLEGLDELVKAGKVRAVGLSNESVWGTMQYLHIAEARGFPRMASSQNEYSLLHRIYDTDFAELSHHEDVGLLAYSPLAAGILSGKYRDGTIPDGSRRSMQPELNGRFTERSEPALEAYLQVADKHGLDPTQMALSFCISRPFMTSVIIGATSMDQLKTCIGAKDVTLSDAVMDDILAVYQKYPLPM